MAASRFFVVVAVASFIVAAFAQEALELDRAAAQIEEIVADVEAESQRYASLKEQQLAQERDMDNMWVVLVTILTFAVIPGFAMLESATAGYAGASQTLGKYVVTATTTALGWWFLGYGLSYGDSQTKNRNAFIGNNDVLLASGGGGFKTSQYGIVTYEWILCTISAIIVTNSVNRRLSLAGYTFVALVWSIFIYPVAAHWAWSTDGWLSPANTDGGIRHLDYGAIDFSGSGVVHVVAGAGSLAALIIVGANKAQAAASDSDRTFALLGTLIIWFGYYGYTAVLGLSGDDTDSQAAQQGKLIPVVTLSAGTSVLSALLTNRILFSKITNLRVGLHGAIAGLVAISASCNVIELYAGSLIGLVAGFLFAIFQHVLSYHGDSLDAFAIHAIPGFWGLFATGLWATPRDTARAYPGFPRHGVFYHGGAQLVGVQLVAAVAFFAWGLITTALLFKFLDFFGLLRSAEAAADAKTNNCEPTENTEPSQ